MRPIPATTMKRPRSTAWAGALAMTTLLLGCGHLPPPAPAPSVAGGAVVEAAFTIQGAGTTALARVLTRAHTCPGIAWDGAVPTPMVERVAPASMAARAEGPAGHHTVDFPVRVCEAPWPLAARTASVEGIALPAPARAIRRITVVADTGCRTPSQNCNDPAQWPFARIAQQAAATHPDLVIHIGDIHYRERPCPQGHAGCADSPWGYGYDVWQADFFQPARPLLASAPWVFVRGNHESCFRAGQGWQRFLDLQPWSVQRSCDDPQWDKEGDFSPPYAVPLGPHAQLLVFDSSKAAGKPLQPSDHAYVRYAAQLAQVTHMAAQLPTSFFLSHHPVMGFVPSRTGEVVNAGNPALQSVMALTQPQRLFAPGVEVAMHGHVHLFESLSFSTPHPATLILGNSGSDNGWDRGLPTTLPPGTAPYPGAVVDDFATTSEYGFATLDREDASDASRWLLTEYDMNGTPMIRCHITHGKSRCTPVRP